MLVSIVADFQENGIREVDRYESWTSCLHRLRSDFEKHGNIEIGKLRDYLDLVPNEQQAEALQDLIAEHLKLKWQKGTGEYLESYFETYGENFDLLSSPAIVPADLVEDEFLSRFQSPHGDNPSLQEYQQRFPGRDDIIECLGQRCLDQGHYIKLKKLGHGAMGDIWKVYDRRSKKMIAIKESSSKTALLETSLNDLNRESTITSSLSHPGIVTLKILQQENSSAPGLYGMPLIDGPSLARLIGKYHNPSTQLGKNARLKFMQQLVQLCREVCEALHYAHSKNIVHGDLKPGNILVDKNDQPAIIDWGMARSLSKIEPAPISRQTLIAGTPEYMPPEQADGFADVRSDVFGLGAILYEILTGSPPHDWDKRIPPADWVHQVKQARITPPRTINPKAPRALNTICMKALAREPDERYQGVPDFARDLEHFITSRSDPLLIRIRRFLRGG